MKTFKRSFIVALITLAIAFGPVTTVRAENEDEAARVTIDLLVARPVGVALTALGGALWVVTLPITAVLGETRTAGRALVVGPYRSTFKRPLGEF
jgi:hypothetical protein